ncbi:MAG TPA: endo-1,4-beta-xylanase [Gemmatimonadaceae bacterium]|nr:endo-1,4-beta-xylanase [Gemmatimonadaceae bacterium]
MFKSAFRVGAALNESQFSERDVRGAALIKAQFNTISPENVLKWEAVHPRPGTFDFTRSDKFVAFGEANNMFVVGHTLVWHSQVPRWVFQDARGQPLGRDSLLNRMREHIFAVVGRYKGRIKGWDVVNEALEEDGSLRKSPWLTIIGDDYIAKAFEFAHEADPAAELYYNDYNLEFAAKRAGAVALVKRLKAAGVTITAVGSQTHDHLNLPTPARMDSTITALAAAGVKVNVTELDVDVLPAPTPNRTADVGATARGNGSQFNPYPDSLPSAVQQALAKRYADLFAVFLKHRDDVDRITFWGVGDGDSWLNNWPMRGRTSYPLLFDRQDRPKPAFDAVLQTARQTVVP